MHSRNWQSVTILFSTIITFFIFTNSLAADEPGMGMGPEPGLEPGPKPELGLKATIQYCTECHGLEGGGFESDYVVPRLAGQSQVYLENQLQNFQDHTRDNPASQKFMWNAVINLSPPMRTAVASYFSGLSNTPPSGGGPKGTESLGKLIFEQGVPSAQILACRSCHGQNAEGNGSIPRLAGQDYLYIKQMFKDWRSGYRAQAAPMPSYAKALTDAQIEGLAAYLSELK